MASMTSEDERAVRLRRVMYYVFSLLRSLQFHAPVVVLFLTSRGLSMTQIMVLQSWFTATCILVDLPSSVLADFVGPKVCVFLGTLLQGASLVLYSHGRRFADFFVAEILNSIGVGTMFGVSSAFLYSSVGRGMTEEGRKQMFATVGTISLAAGSLSSLAGPLISRDGDYGVTLALSGLATCLAAFFLLPITPAGQGTSKGRRSLVDRLRESRPYFRRGSPFTHTLGDVVLYGVILRLAFWCLQPALRMAQVPVHTFGVVYAASRLLSALVLQLVPGFERRVGPGRFRSLSRLGVLVAIVVLASAKVPVAALVGVALLTVVQSARDPIYSVYLNRAAPPEMRATALSISTVSHNLLYLALAPAVGLAVDAWTSRGALLALAILGAPGLWLWRKGPAQFDRGDNTGVASPAA